VLDLPALEPMDRKMDAALRGEFYHAIFHRYAERHCETCPDDPIGVLAALAEELFEERHIEPSLRTLWRPRMRVGFEVFARFDEEARALGRLAGAEVSGEWSFDCGGRTYTLRGRADRIDLAPDGRALIVDYKTGGVPTVGQDRTFSPQLALTALMLKEGAFEGLPPARAYRLAYLDSLPKRAEDKVFIGKHTIGEDEIEEHLRSAFEGLTGWLEEFAKPDTPYPSQPRAFMTNRYGDYDHLARRGEWAGEADAEEEGG
jgi:ATP-dependent helicase/nuclease subunit B